MNARVSLITAVLPAVLFGALPADAGQVRLGTLDGVVEVHLSGDPDDQWRAAIPGQVLLPGDMVRTGSTGRATITEDGRAVHALAPDTLFQLRSGPEVASSGQPPSRPPGVPADRWLELGPGAGIALADGAAYNGSTLEGTLYARRGESWVRIHLTSPPRNPREVVPAR